MAKSQYLYDNFSTTIAVSGKWYSTNALTGVVSGGLMRIRPTATYDAVVALARYDFTNSHLGFKLVQNCVLGAGSNSITLFAAIDSNNSVQFDIAGGRTYANNATITMRERVGGTNSDTTFRYDPAVHVWFRMREAAGTLYWETSVDGTTWTTQRSKTTTLTLTSVEVSFMGGYWGAEAGTTFATIDDFNLWSGIPAAPKMETIPNTFLATEWTIDPNVSISGTQATIAATDYSGLRTIDQYSLLDSFVSVEMLQNTPAGNGTFTWELRCEIDGSNHIRTIVSSEYIYFEHTASGVATSVNLVISPLKHKFFRMRSVGSTITWETSKNSVAWTVQRTLVTTLPLTQMYARINAGYYGTETLTPSVILDNFNTIDGTTIGEPATLAAELFVDDFAFLDVAKWYEGSGGNPNGWHVADGMLQNVPSGVDYYFINSFEAWDISDSHIGFKFKNANRGTTDYGGSITFEFQLTDPNGDFVSFRIAGGESAKATMRVRAGGVVNETYSFTYRADRDKYLRFRGKNSIIYWETSLDGVTWAIKRSMSTSMLLEQVSVGFIAGYYDPLEENVGIIQISDFNIFNVARLKEIGWYTGLALPMGAQEGGTVQAKTYFKNANWIWTPIPDNPVLDPDSEGMGYWLTGGDVDDTFRSLPSLSIGWYGNAVVYPNQIKPDTPRYKMRIMSDERFPDWYFDPTIFDDYMIPIPYGTQIPPGTDAHLTVMDPVQGKVFSFWQTWYHADTNSWSASYGGISDFNGDGRDYIGSATATNISRAAGNISIQELQAGEIPHALFNAISIARPGEGWVTPTNVGGPPPFVYPAQKSDGRNLARAPLQYTVVEGSRLQLNPAIDLASVPGISPAELTIGRAWQKYGCYVGDQGGGNYPSMGAGQLELWQGQDYTPHRYPIESFTDGWDGFDEPTTYPPVPPPLLALGIGWDYFALQNIPWRGNVRVLKNWNGSA